MQGIRLTENRSLYFTHDKKAAFWFAKVDLQFGHDYFTSEIHHFHVGFEEVSLLFLVFIIQAYFTALIYMLS